MVKVNGPVKGVNYQFDSVSDVSQLVLVKGVVGLCEAM